MVEFKSDTFKGKTVVSRLVLTALAVDFCFLLLMAISGAGPLANQNLYWIKYTGARVNGEPFTVLAGMWGTCRIQDSVGFCYKWWDDPFVISIYGNSIFYAIATMQVIAGTLLIVGALSLFLLDPAPFMVLSFAAALFYIPVFSMMQWVATDIGSKLQPYAGYTFGPSMGCGVAALALCIIGTYITGAAVLSERSEERAALANEQGEPINKNKVEPFANVVAMAPAEPAAVIPSEV